MAVTTIGYRVAIASLLGLLLVPPTPVSASDSAVERASLTGLTELTVVVEGLGAAAEKAGLKAMDFQHDAEQRLTQARITLKPDADAYLYVQISMADPGGASPLAYVVNVSLMQEVTLPRGLRTRTPLQCPTWWVTSVGMAGPDRARGAVTDRVHEFVDQFVRAYVSVNPK
jgi:hypothetical protein